jgi:superfamily II DNA or RNA helicase
MNKILKNKNDILFMSATPKEHEIFGTVKYQLSWEDAINNKYICDYNFYYPDNSKIITKIEEMRFDTTIIEKTILINKAYYLMESIKEYNVKKCIVYLKTIKEAIEFEKVLLTINIYFNHNIKVYNINCNTSTSIRNKYLTKFQCDNSSINIMCNVHILDEGIDIPTCDSIYLTHPNNNPTNIIQRISRANRIDGNNKDKIAKIFLWAKDKMKLNNIIDNISSVIKVKYGFMYHVPIENNTRIKQINNIISEYKIITFDKYKIYVIIDNDNIRWFNAKQICLCLEYKDTKQPISNNVNKEDKIQLKNMNISFDIKQQPDSMYIKESGLYSLLISGRTKRAKSFHKWLTT